MKVIIIEEIKTANNAQARESEKLYNSLKKKGVDVHIIESDAQFSAKPLTKKQQKKFFISNK